MFETYMTFTEEDYEKDGFERLYNAQKQKLYFIAYKMLNDEKLAEEAVSEAFLNISVKFDSFKTLSDSQIEAYCVLTLKNICKNIINSESKNNCISIDDCENDDSFLSDIELQYINKMYLKEKISKLKPKEKEVLLLYYFYDLSLREIAKMKKDKSIFAEALAESVIPEILNESLPLDYEHEFSDEFERRMSKIIKRRKTRGGKIISMARRCGASVAAIFVMAAGLSILTDAGRDPAVDYLVLYHYDFDEVRIKCEENYVFPATIEEEYTIEVPEGFELKDETVGEFSQKKYYENNEDYIKFVQEVVEDNIIYIDNEHGINDIITDGDGIKYVIHFDEEEDYYLIMWSNDIYLFTLRTNTSQETALDLCKSTKIK